MAITRIDEARAIVNSVYPNANEVLLNDVLLRTVASTSGGAKVYRPYYAAAFLMLVEYRRLVKADDVTFAYDIATTAKSLLALQSALDGETGLIIPLGMAVDDLLASFDDNNYYVGMIVT